MPDRRTRWSVAALVAVLATMACIAFVDRDAARFAHDTFHGGSAFVALTHLVDPILPLASVGLIVGGAAVLLGWRPGRHARMLLCACAAVLIAVAIKDQAKYAFGRLWPETWVNDNPSWIGTGAYGFFPLHGGTGWGSFPSGHMAVVTAPMAVLALGLPRWRWLFALPVVLVAVGLYGADYHFVGDMVAGALLGTVCAAVAAALTDGRLLAPGHDVLRQPAHTPVVAPQGPP